jgi:hypothetical protein
VEEANGCDGHAKKKESDERQQTEEETACDAEGTCYPAAPNLVRHLANPSIAGSLPDRSIIDGEDARR